MPSIKSLLVIAAVSGGLLWTYHNSMILKGPRKTGGAA